MDFNLKNIWVGGFTGIVTECDCCGRVGLLGTVEIKDLDTGMLYHFGTTCAAKADKYGNASVLERAKKAINKSVRKEGERRKIARLLAANILRNAFGKGGDASTNFVNCSISCFDDVTAQALAHLYKKITDHKAAWLPDIPTQWTGINRYNKA